MDRAKFWAFAKSDAGIVIPNAEVEVFIGDSVSKPTLYADREGNTPLTNPFNAEDNGFFEFYVEGGRYRVEMGAEGATFVLDDVLVGTAQGLDAQNVVDPADLHPVATSGDHSDLNEIGTNTHPQIDAHIASTSNPHDTTIANLDDTGSVGYTNRHCLVADGSKYVSRALVEADISDLQDYILSVDWGDIGGTLANQADLNTALGLKANTADLGAAAFSNDHSDLNEIGTNTHAQIDAHIADADIHREINDAGEGPTDLWSADKIITELGNVEVGTVETGPTIEGDGSSGSPLDVTDGAVSIAKLSPAVQAQLESGYASLIATEATDSSLSGSISINPFDDPTVSVLSENVVVDSGSVEVTRGGIYIVSCSLLVEGAEIINGRLTARIVGGDDLIEMPFVIDSNSPTARPVISAAFRLAPNTAIEVVVQGSSADDIVVREGGHLMLSRVLGLNP